VGDKSTGVCLGSRRRP